MTIDDGRRAAAGAPRHGRRAGSALEFSVNPAQLVNPCMPAWVLNC